MQFKGHLLASGAVLAAFIGATAHAQTRPSTATTIEELVVTAEKREQSLQDVPVAISAFTAEKRDIVGITSIQDYTNFTPGFVYQSQNDRASMRGIGRLTNVHSVDGAVAIYIDGLYTTSTVLAGGPPLETERVEILRGPQGTLYGRNSIGGTVNVISARPTDQPYAELRVIAENYNFTNYQFAASGPVGGGWMARVSGYKLDQREGYYHNVNPGMPTEGSKRNEYEYQVQLQGKIGENLDVWVNYKNLKWDNRGGPGARAAYLNGPYDTGLIDQNFPVVFNPAYGYGSGIVPGSLTQFNGGTITTNPALTDPRAFNTNYAQKVSLSDVHSFTANLTYHADSFDVKYIGGKQNYKYDLYGDTDATNVKSFQIPIAPTSICAQIHGLYGLGRAPVDCSPLKVNADNTYHYFEYPTWYSHEINIASTGNGPLQWIVGAFYYNEKYSGTGQTADFFQSGPSSLQTPILGAAPNPDGVWSTGHYALTTESKALFGQLDWKASDTLKFTLGLRYTKDEKAGNEYRRVVCNSDTCYSGLYPALGLSAFGPGTAANWGSLLGNLAALAQLGPYLGLGNSLAPLAGLGNGGMDLTTTVAPKTTGAKGVTSPVVCTGATCIQYAIDPKTGVAQRGLGDTSDAVTGTLGVQWDPNSDTMMYARYSRGYKAFGLSAGSFLEKPEANPEFVNSYELGLKRDFGRTFQLNAALFYLDYRDLQAPVTVHDAAGTSVTQFVNIAKSRSTGLELDAVWHPTQAWRVAVGYSFNPTRIQKSIPLIDVNDNINKNLVSIVGNRLPQAPEHKLAVNTTYTFMLDKGDLTLGGSYIYRDKAYANVFTRSYNQSPSWDQVDLRAFWKPTGGKYTVIAYVKNVFDTEGYDAAVAGSQRNASFPFAGQNLELTPPRIYGLELQYRFF